MLAQNDDRNELIAMLAWQLDMGIDEALLDHPQADAVPLRLDQLLAVAAPVTNQDASQTVISDAAPQPPMNAPMATSVSGGNPAAAQLLGNTPPSQNHCRWRCACWHHQPC